MSHGEAEGVDLCFERLLPGAGTLAGKGNAACYTFPAKDERWSLHRRCPAR
ncbi:MAG: hypothetical protein KC482_13025 [Dehalococcoidia bacterium]|nr:hypothetical protein [Dehalococcoidia bacterium]MCA9854492.1 hypothetical protein [Dehalococcoidia bacterium]